MPDLSELTLRQRPTALRPLLGLTVLVVEDSRYACEAMRLMCLRSGARIRRADCLASARKHLQVYRPSVVIVDMGLPDGSGAELLHDLHNTTPRIGVLLATSGDDGAAQLASEAGADGFIEKPLTSLAGFQAAILDHIPQENHPRGPRLIPQDVIVPDPIAYLDDMAHAADVLKMQQDPETLAYLEQFLSGIARTAKDPDLADAVNGLAKGAAITALNGLLQERIDGRLAI